MWASRTACCTRRDARATGYRGNGVAMMSDLGHQMALKLVHGTNQQCGHDGLPFPTRAGYTGNPWFLPAVGASYKLRDAADTAPDIRHDAIRVGIGRHHDLLGAHGAARRLHRKAPACRDTRATRALPRTTAPACSAKRRIARCSLAGCSAPASATVMPPW